MECGISDPRIRTPKSFGGGLRVWPTPTSHRSVPFPVRPMKWSGAARSPERSHQDLLATQAQSLDQRPVTSNIVALEIIQQSPALTDNLE